MKIPRFFLCMALFAALVVSAAHAVPPSPIQSAVQAQAQAERTAAANQQKLDQIADSTQAMLNQYLSIAQQTDQLRSYDDQLQQYVQAQQDQINSIGQQMSQVGAVEQGLLPLMLQMVNSLEQFIKLDIPYHLSQRLAAVRQLRETVDDPMVSVADKYRQVIQAYHDEIAAGKTLETWRGELDENGRSRTVNFLRLGHLVLAYQTLDGSETGYWDKRARAWQVADRYAAAVSQGIAMADKQAAPNLLALPVPAPEVGR